jgi:hypothetical protein
MKTETLERMTEDARSVKGAITFSCGRNRLSVRYERGVVIYAVNGWPTDEANAARSIRLQSIAQTARGRTGPG